MTTADDPGALLRARGLRVTPQRRAILGAFSDGTSEHLSAEEIHARAAAVVPEIGRGTVYAALAELTELGLLLARGSPEPVRYETNTAAHQHFRCRLCLRLFDVDIPLPPTDEISEQGFSVEQVTVTADGVCAECADYEQGLRAGARQARITPSPGLPPGTAATTVPTPAGPLALGATPGGVVRAVFADHADTAQLLEAMRARRGARAARAHLDAAKVAIADYVAGRPPGECQIDWSTLDDPQTLRAVLAAPRGQDISYELLATDASAAERGHSLGANPLAILIPCHRVTRGREVPDEYVGGARRRRTLRELEGS
jgi:Fur family ferric uptake transcriptional regulator